MNVEEHICICKEKCIVNSKQNLITVYGSKTTYSIKNPNQKIISKYIVDDCILSELTNEVKCDYLFIVNNLEKKDGYFVELKGADVPKAIIQLLNSIKNLKNNITGVLFGRIICSKFPQAPSTYGSKDFKKLRKILLGQIEIKSNRLLDIIQ